MPVHRRGPWSQAEDQCLMDLVHRQGASNWVRISQMIQSRSPKQCRERYHQNLKPNLNHTPITQHEGQQIEELVGSMGKRWAEIARRLPGRSDNAVKNWWNGGQNRRRRANGNGRPHNESQTEQVQSFPNPGQQYILPPPMTMHHPSPYDRPPLESPIAYPQQGMYSHSKRPEPLDLMAPMRSNLYSPRYHGYPTPLPSPSTHSMSDTPSLISADSSISISPSTPLAMGLPPLIGGRAERRTSAIAWLPAHTTGFVGSDGHFDPYRPDMKHANTPYHNIPTFRDPQWAPRHGSPDHRVSQHHDHGFPQQPLPTYDTLQLNIPPPAERILPSSQTNSPPSARVGISSILNQHEASSSNKAQSVSPTLSESSPQRSSKMDITSLI